MSCKSYFDPCKVSHCWESSNTVVLADASLYYTKKETDELLSGGLEPEELKKLIQTVVEEALTEDVATKDDLSRVEELVRKNAEDILDVKDSLAKDYLTKLQALDMFNAYAKVENETLTLNENILIIP